MALGFAMVYDLQAEDRARSPSPLYAIAEGVFLGVISKAYDIVWNGIALQAILATLATFAVCLVLYSLDIVKVTQKFKFVVIGATCGIFVMYALTCAAEHLRRRRLLLGPAERARHRHQRRHLRRRRTESVPRLRHDPADVVAGAPKSAEWYGAFGITVTIVWLYLEILRLLSYLRN